MRNFRIYGLCAVAATALLMAGCGGGGGTRPEASTPAASSTTPPVPGPVTPAKGSIMDIPQTTSLAATGDQDISIDAGGMMTVGGVVFSCAGDTACTASLMVDAEGVVSGTWTDGEVTAVSDMGSIAVIPQTTGLAAAGDQDISIEPGGMMTVGGVVFSCVGDTACTASLTVAEGVVSGTWTHGAVTTALATGSIADISQTTKLLAEGSGTIEIEAGGSRNRGGVRFTCADATECTVTLTLNEDGDEVTGSWSGGAVTVMFLDPLGAMNATNPLSVATIIGEPIGTVGNAIDDPVVLPGAYNNAVLAGMKNGTLGVSEDVPNVGATHDDLASLELPGAFDPNVTAMSMMHLRDDSIGEATEDAVALAGFGNAVLFADWGDTKEPLRDGGFETLLAVYSNIADATDVDFAGAEDYLMDETASGWFTLSPENDQRDPDQPMVVAGIDDQTQLDNIMIAPGGILELERNIEIDGVVRGTYFGAEGKLRCTVEAGCEIARDSVNDMFTGVLGGTWSFEPDEDATVKLPDQDWLAFGFWLTAPDDIDDGAHRVGVFYDGMDPYGYEGATDTSGNSLIGTASYSGSAAGYYVNRMHSGMFTASATLTATFDTNNSGSADEGENMLTGRINNFRTPDGTFIDSDTRASPNDPNQGGEGDWVVTLGAMGIGNDGAVTGGPVSGSADGVLWNEGEWNAQLYGAGDGDEVDVGQGIVAVPPSPPTGVAGNFRAITVDLNDDEDMEGEYKAVIGAFGATAD